MSCNINIPLQRIIDDVAEALSEGFIKTDNAVLTEAVLNDVTIRGDISVDTAARNALCRVLQTCGLTADELEWLDRPEAAGQIAVSSTASGEVTVSWRSIRDIVDGFGYVQTAADYTDSKLDDAKDYTDSKFDNIKDTQIGVPAPVGGVSISQAEKNSETVSVKRYGIKGDGVTNDTPGFTLLESTVVGREVDLHGLIYKVTKPAVNNIYRNGTWLIGTDLIPVNGELLTEVSKKFDVKVAAKDSAMSLFRMFKAGGRGGNKTVQSAAQDSDGNLYTNHNTQIDDNSTTLSVVNKFPATGTVVTNYSDFMLPEDRLGAQGLTVLTRKNSNTNVLLTTSPGPASGTQNHPEFDYTVGGSYGVVAFRYKSNVVGDIDRPIQYRVLEATALSNSSTTPSITSDGKWLIIKYSGSGQNGKQTFRIFSTKLLNATSDVDISNKYTHEFSFVVSDLINSGDSIHSLSGFCSDGNHLYIMLAGYRSPITDAKYLMSCDLLGMDKEITKGDMFEGSVRRDSGTNTTLIETEGLLIVKYEGVEYLTGVVIGEPPSHSTGARFSALYFLGAKKERKENNVGGINLYGNTTPDKPITIRSRTFDIGGVAQPEALVIDNNGRGSSDLFCFERNGKPVLKAYASTVNVAITAPTGAHKLILGATTESSGSTWNWYVDPITGDYKPYGDNKYSLGSATDRIKEIFAATGVINTSDERLKTQMEVMEAAETRAAVKIKSMIKRYKFLDMVAEKGDNARYHFGVGAQTVGSIMREEGLVPEKYAFYCYDMWEATPEVVEDGKVLEAAKPAGNRYGIRYDELAMFLLAVL